MKVVVCQNDIVPARGEAVDVGSPLAGDPKTALHRFSIRVHWQHHVFAAQLGKRGAQRPESVGMQGPIQQGDGVDLGMSRGGARGVAMAKVDRRVRSQPVQVAQAVDIGDPRTALAATTGSGE